MQLETGIGAPRSEMSWGLGGRVLKQLKLRTGRQESRSVQIQGSKDRSTS